MAEGRLSVASETSSVGHAGYSIFDDTDDLELQQRLDKLELEITQFTFENNIFETILERKKSELVGHPDSSASLVTSSQITTPTGSHHDLISAGGTSRGDRGARKRSKSRSTQSDFRIQLTLEQKLDITTSEYEQTSNENVRRETANEKKIDQLESDIEWIDVEITDFELAITDFLKTKDSSIDKRTQKLIGEKIIRYFNEHLKARETLMNKLRGRSSGFKRQIIHLDIQLRQKEEAGDTLLEVDFHQLKIENKQFLDKIDEKNIELVLFKQQVARVTKLLNRYKDDLNIKTMDLINVQQFIDKQKILYERAQQEIDIVNNEHYRVAKKYYNLLDQTESYRVPEVIDYVRKKALLYKLQRDCQVWQRKVELVSMGLRQSQQEWQGFQRTVQYRRTFGN